MILLFLIASVLKFIQRKRNVKARTIVKRVFVGIVPAVFLVAVIAYYFPTSRIDELMSFVESPNSSVEDIGTLAWRFLVYQEAVDELTHRSVWKLLVGSGTSSSGNVLLAMDSKYEDTLDPNRSMHNEFLHFLYDWGAIGLFLLVLLLVQLVMVSLREYKRHRSWQAMAFLGLFPAMLFGLASENILSTAGQPGGTAYTLVLAALIASTSGARGPILGMQQVSRQNSRILSKSSGVIARNPKDAF
jgi:O-antigen ligase